MYQTIRNSLLVLLIVGLGQCAPETPTQGELIYKNDKDGLQVFGDKQSLINAVRQGYALRIGFGGRSLSDTTISIEHIVDAHFLSVANSQEVFAQIIPINGQIPGLESDTISMDFREGIAWTISVGTNGYSDRITFNKLNNMVEGHQKRSSQVSWFVKGYHPDDHSSAKPLY